MTPDPRTLRLLFPQWQGGDIAGYALGAAVLDRLIPALPSMSARTVAVPAPPAHRTGLLGSEQTERTSSYDAVHDQLRQAIRAVDEVRPDRVLVLGGDCAVSIAPFSWLFSRYPDLGIVWLDAHPDMWAAEHQPHANARAVAILSGQDDSGLVALLPSTVPLDRFVWVGTRAELVPQLVDLDRVRANCVRVNDAEASPQRVVERLRSKGARHIAVHFDLDVLDAEAFHGVAVGERSGMSWDGVGALIGLLDAEFSLVGLTVAEHVPEGLERLRQVLAATSLMGGSGV